MRHPLSLYLSAPQSSPIPREALRVDVAERNGQRIGHIGRMWCSVERKEMLDRALHLELGGIAIARYGLLHSLGGKTQHRDSCQPRR